MSRNALYELPRQATKSMVFGGFNPSRTYAATVRYEVCVVDCFFVLLFRM